MHGFRNILFATDFSETSELACQRAVELARQSGATLTIFHAYADPTALSEAWAVIDPRPDLERTLLHVASDVHDVEIHRVIYMGAPAELIVEYAQQHNSDLIVMGTHGRSGLSHLLLGSVAEKVIRCAPCPVMVVRQQAAARRKLKTVATRFQGVSWLVPKPYIGRYEPLSGTA
jgi:nucleotide-binding universal stress UspA family protein